MGGARSYVISAQVRVGCYRHIRIGGQDTLYDLHEAILEAFDFIDDHAHAFFMNNRPWDQSAAYYCPEIAEDEDEDEFLGETDDVTLDELGLAVGSRFMYIFDFGHEWRFALRVLKVLPEATDEASVTRSFGAAPVQYGDDEEEDWDE